MKPLLLLPKSFGMIKTLLVYIFYSLEIKNFMVSIVTIRYFREVFQMVTKLTIGVSGTDFGKSRQVFVPLFFFRRSKFGKEFSDPGGSERVK